jgi:adenine-specific DNA-methyltransferase
MTQAYEKLKRLLEELFQFDREDLDFGIYRIMNQKRAEVSKFLDHDLLSQVQQTFGRYQTGEADRMLSKTADAGLRRE